ARTSASGMMAPVELGVGAGFGVALCAELASLAASGVAQAEEGGRKIPASTPRRAIVRSIMSLKCRRQVVERQTDLCKIRSAPPGRPKPSRRAELHGASGGEYHGGMRSPLCLCLFFGLLSATGGCDSAPPKFNSALLGNYDVTITSKG